jgi:hypothetical protein
MARIRGTTGDDFLYGSDGLADRIVARAGNDTVYAGGSDFVYGGLGNDRLVLDGYGFANGELGNDEITITGAGLAVGGFGNDHLKGGGGATLVGGKGDDFLEGTGNLYGDKGNDYLTTLMDFDTLYHVTDVGGRGNDTFAIGMHAEGTLSQVDVLDFTAGVDKLSLYLNYGDGTHLPNAVIFAVLDTNANGVLGDDQPLDGNSAAISDVAANTLQIRLHEDLLTLHGVNTLAASDFVF